MNIEVRVIPGAKKREIRRQGRQLRIRLLSRPVEGKANEELIEYLSDLFGVRKREIRIVSGETNRSKVVSLPVTEGDIDRIVPES